LRRADPPSNSSYQLHIRFIISRLIQNGDRPVSPILLRKRKKMFTRVVKRNIENEDFRHIHISTAVLIEFGFE
jgi:hypothetical protein